jgi:membrane dipeptidase
MPYIGDDKHFNFTIKQACRLIETLYRTIEANSDKTELALTSADVRRIVASGKMAQVLGLEGGFDMDGDLDVLRFLYRAKSA